MMALSAAQSATEPRISSFRGGDAGAMRSFSPNHNNHAHECVVRLCDSIRLLYEVCPLARRRPCEPDHTAQCARGSAPIHVPDLTPDLMHPMRVAVVFSVEPVTSCGLGSTLTVEAAAAGCGAAA